MGNAGFSKVMAEKGLDGCDYDYEHEHEPDAFPRIFEMDGLQQEGWGR